MKVNSSLPQLWFFTPLVAVQGQEADFSDRFLAIAWPELKMEGKHVPKVS